MKVSLFIPCLVDRFLPQAGIATARLLESVGLTVRYDPRQTCCGQPAYNAGHRDMVVPYARRMLKLLADDSAVVVSPSGSCVAMVRDGYGLLDLSEEDFTRWNQVRGRIFELAEFLHAQGLHEQVQATLEARAVVHHTCHHLRHIGAQTAHDALLARISGLEVVTSPQAHQCCGFGGVFSMKLPELSVAIGRQRLAAMEALRPDVIALADAGCVIHLRGIAQAAGEAGVPIVHYAQLFTGDGLDALGKEAS